MDPTDWQTQLITLYCYLTTAYQRELWVNAERLSPNHRPAFTDEEVLTIYLFGLWQQLRTLGAIYRYTRAHLSDGFPRLPSYGGFVQRLNRLSAVLGDLDAALLQALTEAAEGSTYLVDSLPICLAQQPRASRARVAPEWANKGYCASKQQYYHGVKLHLLALHRPGTLPLPAWGVITPASENDLTVLKQHQDALPAGELFADKIYRDQPWRGELFRTRSLQVHTPVKRAPAGPPLEAADRLYSRAVSRVRQPIETLFHWIDEKTGLQDASRVRSSAGLWVHIFGRLAAALLLCILNS